MNTYMKTNIHLQILAILQIVGFISEISNSLVNTCKHFTVLFSWNVKIQTLFEQQWHNCVTNKE